MEKYKINCERETFYMIIEEMDVIVTRYKRSDKKCTVKYKDISDLKWDMISGGAKVPMGTYDLYGYVSSAKVEELSHSSSSQPIKVCILKIDNPDIYEILTEKAGAKPKESFRDGKNASERIREIVRNKPGIPAVEVADILEKEGIERKRTANAIRRLKTTTFKQKDGLYSEKYKNTQKLTIRSFTTTEDKSENNNI